ncbi:leucine-rich repeat domain-containing protein [Treponema socranskii]|uniref:leucine-rich repeat domain-containing protein n=1 Tax=Treponema socranskii TaxID=53419 RepID=UPI003D90C407
MIFEKWEPAVPASFPSSDAVYTAKFRAPRLTIKGDERIKNKSDNFIEAGKGKKWKDIKTKAAEKAVFQYAWNTGDYGIHEWHLDDETGRLLTDNDSFAQDTTVYAVTNYTNFTWSGTKITGVTGSKPEGKIIIPDGCTEIGAFTFGQSYLTQVSLPASLTSIGKYAFGNCSSLQQVNFPENLISIGENAFEGCRSLQQVNFPKNLTAIGTRAFQNCSDLKQVDLSTCTALTKIGERTFSMCSKLEKVEFPKNLTKIEEAAFFSCTNLTQAVLVGCTALSEIGVNAFNSCQKLTYVTMPKNLSTIGHNAFSGCSGVNEFNFYTCTAITAIGHNAFSLCDSARFKVKYMTTVKDKLIAAGVAAGKIDEIY